jgi:hypothetical protein
MKALQQQIQSLHAPPTAAPTAVAMATEPPAIVPPSPAASATATSAVVMVTGTTTTAATTAAMVMATATTVGVVNEPPTPEKPSKSRAQDSATVPPLIQSAASPRRQAKVAKVRGGREGGVGSGVGRMGWEGVGKDGVGGGWEGGVGWEGGRRPMTCKSFLLRFVGVATSRSLQVMETHPRKQLARPKLEAPFVFSHRI